jgi:hypothetical protein
MNNFEVSCRHYRGASVVAREQAVCADFDEAMAELEKKIAKYNAKNFHEKDDL